MHGEAFNEGPRQAAHFIKGIGNISFPCSSKVGRACRFVEQGVAQLHGFWYLEAERSFRQAAKEDPNAAIAYWGMAMANVNNLSRARGFIDQAMELRKDHADNRERLYIESLQRWIPELPKEDSKPETKAEKKTAASKRYHRLIADLEDILHQFPNDLEAKAFLVATLWKADSAGVKLTSRYAVDALLEQIFAVAPNHPAHHYRIHLWDSKRAANALESAALCGPAAPSIAHMWHMPGHTYSKLKRYDDAAWQQEASARCDHAHMIRTRLLPDQIHNFAHNNEWLIRNLLFSGRVDEALNLSKNLISLPRHPKYNTLSKGGSFKFGRQRLLQALTQYGLWQELIREAGGFYLVPSDDEIEQETWLSWLAVAYYKIGNRKKGGQILRSLQRRSFKLQTQLLDIADRRAGSYDGIDSPASPSDAEEVDLATEDEPTPEEIRKHIESLRVSIARASAASACNRKQVDAVVQRAKAARLDPIMTAMWIAEAGDRKQAITIVEKALKGNPNEVIPLAVLTNLLWRSGDQERAKRLFARLRKVAHRADPDLKLLRQLAPVARSLGIEGDWRLAVKPAADLGKRPPLDEIGPFRWSPYPSPDWGARMADGKLRSSEEFEGKPRIVIFYLGFGCLHCVEQLHEFEPRLSEFRDAGIEIVALSTESVKDLSEGLINFEKEMTIELLSDSEHAVFKEFRCWDDFEGQPLHGTFLIDARDQVRWQDIGYEPFMDADFLLKESKRLLALP